jgi:hypothetical protein
MLNRAAQLSVGFVCLATVACSASDATSEQRLESFATGCTQSTYQAETMKASTGGPTTNGWNIWSNGDISTFHDFYGGSTRIDVVASGSPAQGGWPHMIVRVNGQQIGDATVSSTAWQIYSFTFSAAAGSQSLSVAFDNDLLAGGEDRNLLVDKVVVSCLAPTTVAPTPRADGGGDASTPPAVGAGAGDASADNPGSGAMCPNISGTPGWTSRFWDCCKGHCGWSGNSSPTLSSCSASNQKLSGFDDGSACSGGAAYMCYDFAPWSVSSTIAYGYAATPTGNDSCGRCYAIQFTGTGHNGDDAGSVALKGKTLIVQTVNVGGDVSQGQFDLMIPGGGVGMFNACSSQWGVSGAELGDQYGGLLATCRRSLNYGGSLQQTQGCLRDKCNGLFTDARGLGAMRAGCLFYADWMMAADNPNMVYREVACPAALTQKSGLTQGGSSSDICGG